MVWLVSVVVFLVVSRLAASVYVSREESQTPKLNRIIELNNNCKCVLHYQCDANNNIITDGKSIIEKREIRISPRIQCEGSEFPNEIVCCKLTTENTSLAPSGKSSNTDVKFKTEGETMCGTQKFHITPRSTLAEKNDPIDGEFPWIAAIFNKTSHGNHLFHCNGALIHPQVVLTANHCVHKKQPSNFMIVLNGKTEFSVEETASKEKRDVSEIIKHPQYASSGRLTYDAALLILDKPFEIEYFVNTLCLPPSDVNLNDAKCLVAGWEEEEPFTGGLKIRSIEVPFINRDKCQDNLRKTWLGESFNLDESFICAGENWRDAYKRDSGSPLMCPLSSDGDRYFQAGIVSWGNEHGLNNVPGVYAKVQKIVEWIKNELQKRNLNI